MQKRFFETSFSDSCAFFGVNLICVLRQARAFVLFTPKTIPTIIFFLVLGAISYFLLLCLYISRLARHGDEVRAARLGALQANLGTGDIILFRHKKYNLPAFGGVNRIVSHMGVLWRRGHELLVVDMNPEPNGPYGDHLPFECVIKGTKTLVYRLADALDTYPGEIFVRRLKIKASDEAELCFSSMMVNWAIDLEYMETIANRSILTYLAFILGIMTKPLAWLFASLSDLGAPRTASFCSEMIGEILSRCEIADLKGIPLHFSGPINWIHDLGELQSQFSWSPEVQLVR